MSAVTDLDADAFMRKYLERPSDSTARLVFADWLEETGQPHNRAWAHFLRLKCEATLHPFGSRERCELDRWADRYANHVRARLTIPARLFVGYPRSLLQLLPAPNITVRLAEFAVSRAVLELVPESIARENLVFPLDAQDRALLVAAVDPRNFDTAQKLEFILNRDVVLVGAESDDMRNALDREYGQTETESVDSVLVEFTDTASPFTRTDAPGESQIDGAPLVRLVNLILREAIRLRADRVHMFPELDGVAVRYRIDGEWIERDRAPLPLLRRIAARLAIMAGIPVEWTFTNPPSLAPIAGEFLVNVPGAHFGIRVTIQPSPDGPTTQIDLVRDPPPVF
jgi:type IV pilus assembly protein PilB